MYQVLSKDRIELEKVPYFPQTKKGFKPRAPFWKIVNALLYKLKLGVQQKNLPVKSLFRGKVLPYKTVLRGSAA